MLTKLLPQHKKSISYIFKFHHHKPEIIKKQYEANSYHTIHSIRASMGEEHSSFVRLEEAIADLDATNEYFMDIFRSKGFGMGTLRLRKGEIDTQEPHSVDEVYFVIEGTGHIEIEDKMKPVNRGDFIFLPANVHHRFVVGNKDLMVLYFFDCS